MIVPLFLPIRSQAYRRMKLMVVGEANKGKTSLLLSLTRQGKVQRFKEVELDRHRQPLATNGVELGDWEFAPRGRKDKVTFMTWDFGGQVSFLFHKLCAVSPNCVHTELFPKLIIHNGD